MSQLTLLDAPSVVAPVQPTEKWRLPSLLVRGADGKFRRRPLPEPSHLFDSLDGALAVQKLLARPKCRPRSIEECRAWLRFWWGERSALDDLLRHNEPLVTYIIKDVGRRADPTLWDEAHASLMASMAKAISRYDPLQGSVDMWLIYKLKNEAKNFFSRDREKEARQERVAEAAQAAMAMRDPVMPCEMTEEAIEARDTFASLADLAGSDALTPRSWLVLCLMLTGITEEKEIRVWTGWKLRTVTDAVSQMRLELSELEF